MLDVPAALAWAGAEVGASVQSCVRLHGGHALLQSAATYAAQRGARVVEGYPVDNQGEKVDLTMAYVAPAKLFEDAGFTLAARTDATSGGFPRVVMRRSV